ncbi:MAG: CHRD domain-containing protein, partial [Betaproteobacteria bacterium]
PAESPANASPGTGDTIVTYDAVTQLLTISVNFTGLQGTTTASHIHCCTAVANAGTAGVATQTPTFVGFPLGVTAGTYSNTFDLTQAASWNPAFITANGGTPATAEAAFAAGLLANKTYLNIHTTTFPSGEIRSFLAPQTAPSIGVAFAPAIITTGSGTSLVFTLTNPASNPIALTGVGFTDTLAGGLGVAAGSTGVCGGTLTTTTTTITLTGATIAQGGQCQFSVPLINAPVGTFVNSTGVISAGNAGIGNSASATLFVGTTPLIPTLSTSMIALLAAFLFGGTFYFMRKRRQ